MDDPGERTCYVCGFHENVTEELLKELFCQVYLCFPPTIYHLRKIKLLIIYVFLLDVSVLILKLQKEIFLRSDPLIELFCVRTIVVIPVQHIVMH